MNKNLKQAFQKVIQFLENMIVSDIRPKTLIKFVELPSHITDPQRKNLLLIIQKRARRTVASSLRRTQNTQKIV